LILFADGVLSVCVLSSVFSSASCSQQSVDCEDVVTVNAADWSSSADKHSSAAVPQMKVTFVVH